MQTTRNKVNRPWLILLGLLCVSVVFLFYHFFDEDIYRDWTDAQCLRWNWTLAECSLHAGSPQVVTEPLLKEFADAYEKHVTESHGYRDMQRNQDGVVNCNCIDSHQYCALYATLGHCEINPSLRNECKLSCRSCGVEDADTCSVQAEGPEIPDDDTAHSVPTHIAQPNVKFARKNYKQLFETHVLESSAYIRSLAAHPTLDPYVRAALPRCANRFLNCTQWALQGMCNGDARFPGFLRDMRVDCALACRTCDHLLYHYRCPLNLELPNQWDGPGRVHQFFTELTREKRSGMEVHSSPTMDGEHKLINDTAPWLVTIDDFLTPHEADVLVELGKSMGYSRSEDWSEYKEDGTVVSYFHDGRTSHQVWCNGACFFNETVENVHSKIAALTKIPFDFSEPLQLLRYQETQKYDVHHDWDAIDAYRQQGVRILTVFLYMNDMPVGGGTHFPHVGVTLQPRRGRVALWPNVRNEEPHEKDPRTEHAALPVSEGVKYSANGWYHQRNVREISMRNCYS